MLPFYFYSNENLEKHKEVFDRISLSYHALQGQMHSESSPRDLVERLPEVDIPTLIIVGSDDFICPPSAAQFLHDRIRKSELLVIENAGHFPWFEQPEQFFGGIQNFLAKRKYRTNERG